MRGFDWNHISVSFISQKASTCDHHITISTRTVTVAIKYKPRDVIFSMCQWCWCCCWLMCTLLRLHDEWSHGSILVLQTECQDIRFSPHYYCIENDLHWYLCQKKISGETFWVTLIWILFCLFNGNLITLKNLMGGGIGSEKRNTLIERGQCTADLQKPDVCTGWLHIIYTPCVFAQYEYFTFEYQSSSLWQHPG